MNSKVWILFVPPRWALHEGFVMKNRPIPHVRFVCYGLKCCMDVRISIITTKNPEMMFSRFGI
jgi:hypothetical protein